MISTIGIGYLIIGLAFAYTAQRLNPHVTKQWLIVLAWPLAIVAAAFIFFLAVLFSIFYADAYDGNPANRDY